MSSTFEDLTKKLMDEHIVTKAEMIQAIHENNSGIKNDLKEQFAEYQLKLAESQKTIQEQWTESQKEARIRFSEYQKESRLHTRWLVGIGVTLIVGVAALIIKTHF